MTGPLREIHRESTDTYLVEISVPTNRIGVSSFYTEKDELTPLLSSSFIVLHLANSLL
jgi:hypothetical protein